jgi:DNA-binding transcriptional LysR family regulator
MLLPRLSRIISQQAPNIQLQMVDLVPDNNPQVLQSEQIDLALIPDIGLPDWTESQRVLTSSFVVVARQGNHALHEAGISPGETIPIDLYCELRHVLFSSEGNLFGIGDVALKAINRKRQVSMTAPFFNGVANAVANSELIALLPQKFAQHVQKRLNLAIYEPPMAVPKSHIYMAWHRRNNEHLPHIWFRETVRAALQELEKNAAP